MENINKKLIKTDIIKSDHMSKVSRFCDFFEKNSHIFSIKTEYI